MLHLRSSTEVYLFRIGGTRRKLYVGTIDGPIQMCSTSPASSSNNIQQPQLIPEKSLNASESFAPPSIDDSLLQLNSNLTPLPQDSLLEIPLQTIVDDDIFTISDGSEFGDNIPHSFKKNNKHIRQFIDNFRVECQKNLKSKTITLHFSYDDPEELYIWAKHVTVEDLFKTPIITYINER